jgi:hypothetical protein
MGLRKPFVPISRPAQQVAAVIATRDFLFRLTQPQLTPRVGIAVRGEARALLRHYPLPAVLRPVLTEGLERAAAGDGERASAPDHRPETSPGPRESPPTPIPANPPPVQIAVQDS